MLTDTDKIAAARRWVEAWNRRDLDAILEHYADDVEFHASTVVARWGRPDGTLRGKDELREHFSRGLALVPDLRFALEDILLSPDGYAVIYRRENGNRVIDAVELDAGGHAARVHAYYATRQA
ncbi:nuclear transport factor 2 family protein [Planotetraspora mira]|uniref:Polyketide cyclase n=1 Tax=Planotetraspora mira TaxID=58121 RepID=A0A8J3XEV1_9ACTN|nr:nuclear transport factor 2 family protein [Planotetraspora mira]GII33873.1 polyketide cyclase [Planotetraspora mira]